MKVGVRMRYYLLAELRENYPNLIDGSTVYNDYVSRKSMNDFCEALNKIGLDCTFFGGMKELLELYKSHTNISDIIFINYNYGLPSNYKRAQSPILLELIGAKYSGSDPFSMLLANDKEFTKKVVRSAKIGTPTSALITDINAMESKLESFNISFPVVVKPNCEGSSLGITSDCLCTCYDEMKIISQRLLKKYSEVIVEQYIAGYECTVWLIGNPYKFHLVAPLLISVNGDLYFKNKIFTMTDKANRIRKYDLPEERLELKRVSEIVAVSKKIFEELGLRDYARLDFRLTHDEVYFIEANPLPIFSQTSEIGSISNLYGISYEQLCKMMVDSVNERLMTQAD